MRAGTEDENRAWAGRAQRRRRRAARPWHPALPAPAEQVSCGGRVATIVGTDGDDRLDGTPGVAVIAGLDGEDHITGGGGGDVICGGPGDDEMLAGGPGDDTILAGSGNDRIYPGTGADVVHGRSGGDRIRVRDDRSIAEGTVHHRVTHGSGWGGTLTDVEDVVGSIRDDVIRGDAGPNHLQGLIGHDELFGRGGDDVLHGGGLSGQEDSADGGPGTDRCYAPHTSHCEE